MRRCREDDPARRHSWSATGATTPASVAGLPPAGSLRLPIGSLTALGLERHQALVVAHGDTGHPHVHVIVNRVDPETGKAARLSNSTLRLSKWAEEYERRQGEIRCEKRFLTNLRRREGTRRQDRVSLPTGRHRRERMNPHREQRRRIPAGQDPRTQARVA